VSVFDVASKVVTYFMADTTDMRKKTKELVGDERKLAEAQLEAAEARNSQYKDWVKGLGNANQALEMVNKAVSFAKDAWKSYADNLRLTAAAGKTDIEALRKASLGLRTEHELLSFAAKTQNGVIKTSAADMETAQRAMVALTRAGFDQDQVYQKITNSMVKAKTEGLDEFGLAVKQGKTDAETYANVMAALAEKASSVKDGSLTGAEGVDAMGVRMHDAIEKMKQAVGRLIVALEPLLTALSKAVELIADLATGHMDVRDKGGVGGYILDAQMKAKGMVRDPDSAVQGVYVDQQELNARLAHRNFMNAGDVGAYRYRSSVSGFAAQGNTDNFTTGLPKLLDLLGGMPTMDPWTKKSLEDDVNRMLAKLKGGKGKGGVSFSDIGSVGFDSNAGLNKSWLDSMASRGPGGFAISGNNAQGSIEQYDLSGLDRAQQEAMIEKLREQATAQSRYDEFTASGRGEDSFLSKTFGPLEQFDQYRAAFEGFSNAMGGTFEAIITGSEPAGKAFKRLIADSLMGIGKQSSVEALKETAYAVGNFAMGNVAGGTMHLKSAALHAGVAIAAGYAAQSIGTSAQVSAADKAAEEKAKEDEKAKKDAGKKKGSSEGGAGEKGRDMIIVYSDPWAQMTGSERGRNAKQLVQKALGGPGGSDE
jgi:hypothetical protein